MATTAQLQKAADAAVKKYGPQVAKLFGMDPAAITVTIGPAGVMPHTSGTAITLPADWDPKNLGALVFEISNATLQATPNANLTHPIAGSADSTPTVALANFARYTLAPDPTFNQNWGTWTLDAHAQAVVNAYHRDKTSVQTFASGVQNGTATMADIHAAGGTQPAPQNPNVLNQLTPGQLNPAGTGGGTDLGGVPPGAGGTGGTGGIGAPPPPPPPPTATGATPAMIKARDEGILSSWGIAITPNLQNVINHSASAGWSSQQFLNALYGQPEFHTAFPGIFNANGTLKMTPAQYQATQKSYQTYAAVNGVNLSPQQQSYLFRNDVSPAEFNQRSQALNMLENNKQYFAAFNQQLKMEGKQPLTPTQQFQFVMGQGNQEWYQTWQQASTRYAGEQSGIKFGKVLQNDLNLGQPAVKQIAGLGLTEAQTQQGFAQLAQNLQTVLPQSRIQKYGLSKQDLIELQFGGKRQAAVAARVSQILANEKARAQGQGQGNAGFSQVGQNQRGVQEGF